jgi:hypothetical protein
VLLFGRVPYVLQCSARFVIAHWYEYGFALGDVLKTARPALMPSRSNSGLSSLNVSMAMPSAS